MYVCVCVYACVRACVRACVYNWNLSMLDAISVLLQGCYGEPIFNRFFGVALSYLIITLPTFPEPYTDGIFIDPSLAVSILHSQTVCMQAIPPERQTERRHRE